MLRSNALATRLAISGSPRWLPMGIATSSPYPQYGAVPDCRACTAPTIALLISDDNGASWQPSKPLLPFPTGQFDPQIVVDPVDRQTIYASWMQNSKRDIVVARSLDFGRTWSFSWAERGREDADKPVLAVRGQMLRRVRLTKRSFSWRLRTMLDRLSAW